MFFLGISHEKWWFSIVDDGWWGFPARHGGTQSLDALFHGKSHELKWMITRGTPMTMETSTWKYRGVFEMSRFPQFLGTLLYPSISLWFLMYCYFILVKTPCMSSEISLSSLQRFFCLTFDMEKHVWEMSAAAGESADSYFGAFC